MTSLYDGSKTHMVGPDGGPLCASHDDVRPPHGTVVTVASTRRLFDETPEDRCCPRCVWIVYGDPPF